MRTLIFWLIISVLSAWRLTQLFHEEDGPKDILQRLRDHLGATEFSELPVDDQNEIIIKLGLDEGDILPIYDVRTFFGKLFDCVRCLSIWTAFPHAVVLYGVIRFPIVFIPILTGAISEIIVAIYEN